MIDIKQFSKLISDTAKNSIGIANNKSIRPQVPWWNEKIKTSIINKNKSLKKFQNTHNPNNFILLKRHRAGTKLIVKHS